jgi:anionic cell wall polymer biosynthesis LytR-Cps2A-Psr (LCP) family protein
MERPRRTVLSVIVASLVLLGLLTGVGVVVAYENWNGNIDHRSLDGQLKHRPKKHNKALNILVLGDDTRAGKNKIDNETGGGSDTTILFHLSADRTFAYGISIPRDTAVKRPTCYRPDGSEIPASTGWVKWNAAYAVGGAACTIQQVEQLTGVHVDRFVVVDFNGLKSMVDALDGSRPACRWRSTPTASTSRPAPTCSTAPSRSPTREPGTASAATSTPTGPAASRRSSAP